LESERMSLCWKQIPCTPASAHVLLIRDFAQFPHRQASAGVTHEE
jgi:hypothetical protein